MPKELPTDGSEPLSNAERQARYRARKAEQAGAIIRYRRPADRRTRPQRWHDAVAELLALQADYTAWAAASRRPYMAPPPARHSRPSWISTCPNLPTSNRPAATDATDPKQSGEISFATNGEISSAVDKRSRR